VLPWSRLTAPLLYLRVRYGNLASLVRRREDLARRWLTGRGIEVGALHKPLPVPTDVRVCYVDRMSTAELYAQYPELTGMPLVPVDRIDNGERLETFVDDSQSFIIGNHLLEHCEDPIGMVSAWMRVLKPGGIAYLAVPDKRFTFDSRRLPTDWFHLLADRRDGGIASRTAHYREWAEAVEGLTGEAAAIRAQSLVAARYSIHFHVWTTATLVAFFERCSHELELGFALRDRVRNGVETLVILQKHSVGQDGPPAPL